jgi:hypothetical protein
MKFDHTRNVAGSADGRKGDHMKAVVKRTGRTWSVFNGQELIEGGFFTRSAAVATRDELNSVPQHGASCRCQGCSELRKEAK